MTANVVGILHITAGDTIQARRLADFLSATSRRTWQIRATVVLRAHKGQEVADWMGGFGRDDDEYNLPHDINSGGVDEVWLTDMAQGFEWRLYEAGGPEGFTRP